MKRKNLSAEITFFIKQMYETKYYLDFCLEKEVKSEEINKKIEIDIENFKTIWEENK